MTKTVRLFPAIFLSAIFSFAQGTQTWQQRSYEDFSKGTSKGVALRSDGTLGVAPAFEAVYTAPSTYIWCAAAQVDGSVFVGAGSPARVYRVTADGKASVVFEPKELQVQALALDKDGTLYAATSPDGKVYKIIRAQNGEYSAAPFFDPKSKYIWALATDNAGNVFVGTGDRGEIFRVNKTGDGSVFFKSDEAHIRSMAFDASGNLIVGTDGSGLIYRISPKGEGFVLYSAAKKEITALALDGDGNIYAAGVGEKRSGANPNQPLPIMAAPGGPAGGPMIGGIVGPVTGGSDIYMISSDGAPKKLWSAKEDIVYSLTFDSQKRLLAGTGNKGRIVAIEKDGTFSDLVKVSASQITAFAAAPKGALYATSSNLGKVFRLNPSADAEGTFESDVFDAKNFSRWGRAQVRGSGGFQFFTRSGNVDNPDRNWSPWARVDLNKGARVESPSARFIQWKAVLPAKGDASVDDVLINYLSKNVAPVVEEIVVQTGARINANNFSKPNNDSVQINLSSQSQNNMGGAPIVRFEPPMSAQKDKSAIAVRWGAHDDNDDDLVYAIYYRGDGESRWKLLKDNITDKFYSFDAALLPDGGYTLRVVGSDAPSHSPDETLTAEKVSARFEVDTTPPRVESLNAKVESDKLHITFAARDNFSPLRRAEYSIDAGDWQYVEPMGHLSDSQTENYDLTVAIPHASDKFAATGTEHTIVVRAYDRFDNMGMAKIVVK
jgi:hypothetical protein